MTFSRNLLKLLSSKIVIQLFLAFTAPLLTRLFQPAHFGLLQIFDTLATPLLVIACLRYEQAIPLGQTPRETIASFVVSLCAAGVVGCGCLVAVIFGRGHLADWFHASELAAWLWFLPLLILLTGAQQAVNLWATREQAFGSIARAGLGDIFSDRLTAISSALIWPQTGTGLFWGRLAGALMNVGILVHAHGANLRCALQHAHLTAPTLSAVAWQHRKFLLFSAWDTLLLNLTAQLPPFIFGLYFAPRVVGFYALAQKMFRMQNMLFTPAIAQVFFASAAAQSRVNGDLTALVKSLFLRLTQFYAFPIILLTLFGARLFGLIFGAAWREAGAYAQILAGWYFFSYLNYSMDIFTLVKRQELSLLFNALSFGGRFASLLLGIWIFGAPRPALLLFAAVSMALLAIRLLWQLRLANVELIWALKTLGIYVTCSSLLLIPIAAVGATTPLWLGGLALAAAGYIALIMRCDASAKQFFLKHCRPLFERLPRSQRPRKSGGDLFSK